jgi:hypothetical protein
MNREQFDHAIRAAAGVAGVSEVLVIGSQATHASIEAGLPEAAQRSVEADIAILGDQDGARADLVDASIGEASMFHETFGYYAQGVTIDTAVLADGWEGRLVRYETPATNGVVAWCLSLEDLFVSKSIAGRPKDLEFCRSILDLGAADVEMIRNLIDGLDAVPARKKLAMSLISSESRLGDIPRPREG